MLRNLWPQWLYWSLPFFRANRGSAGIQRARRVRLWLESLESRYAPSVLYNESVSGDLSNNPSAPTALTLGLGTNSVIGTVNGSTDLQDWITLHIPANLQLSSVVLASYVSTDQQGFTGVQQGTSFVGSVFNPASYLGYAHFGTGATNGALPATNLVGTDLLPLMGDNTIEFGSQGFAPPLASGDYTWLIQQQGALTSYQFDFDTTSTAPPPPTLAINTSHTGSFKQGDAADTYKLQVSNTGAGPTSGTVSVTDTLPTGLSPTAADNGTMNGWSVSASGQTITATRSDALAAGSSYPNLTVTVAVASNAPASVTNSATVSGGGASSPANSSDPTTITQVATKLIVSTATNASVGIPVNLTVTAQDGGGNTVTGFNGNVTLSCTAGPDISPTNVMLSAGTATVPVTLTGTGTQTVTAAFSGLTSGAATVSVNPGPLSKYVVAVQGTGTVAAGSGLIITAQAADAFGNPITNYSGPATLTMSASPASAPGNFPLTVPVSGQGLAVALGQLLRVGSYTIMASSGSFNSNAVSVTVTPAAAVKLGFGTQPANRPTGVILSPVTVQVLDAFGNVVTTDNTDTVTLSVASGPGSFTSGSTTTATVQNGVATFNNLTLVAPGSYTLNELVTGQLTGPASSLFSVAPLRVIPGSFTGTPSGFSLSFNAPFLINSITPVLYGQGFGTNAPVPSVTLTGPSGLVEGSLVLNASTHSITFVETDTASMANNSTPILPDGTYKVTVRSSGPTGFQALNAGGGSLDGLGSGTPGSGDFTTTFTVSAASSGDDVVWVPATADGPGPALSAPGANQSGGGYPVFLTDTHGNVDSVQVTLNYNPAVLTITGVTGTGFSLLASSTPGQALLQYSSPALPTGTTPLGFLTATVPSGTAANPIPYRMKDLLHLSNVAVSGSSGPVPVTTADAVHLVAYVGDADGNGSYSSNDAVLITRVALQTDTGFTAYPLVDPVIVADTDGSGFIPADASLQVNEAGVGFPTANLHNPPIPAGVVFVPVSNNVDPSLSLPAYLAVSSRGTITVPVNLDDAHPAGSTGLIRAQLALRFDPSQLIISTSDVHLGSVPSAGIGWTMQVGINSATGEIAITLASTTPIGSPIQGSLVTIDVHPLAKLSNTLPIALVASVNPAGQQVFLTNLQDAQGTFTLTPALSDNSLPA